MPGWAKYMRVTERAEKVRAKAVERAAGAEPTHARVRLPIDLAQRCEVARGTLSLDEFIRQVVEQALDGRG